MLLDVKASAGVGAAIATPFPARADHPVADAPDRPDTQLGVVVAEPDGDDVGGMEHRESVESAREMCNRGAKWSEIVAAHPSKPWAGELTTEPEVAVVEHDRQSRLRGWQRLP